MGQSGEHPGRLSTLGRAAVYFYCRGDPALAGCLIGRLGEGKSLREVSREYRVKRQVAARRTEEFIGLMRVFCEEYAVDVAEMVFVDEAEPATTISPERGGTQTGSTLGRR